MTTALMRGGKVVRLGAGGGVFCFGSMNLQITAGTHEGNSNSSVTGVAPCYVFFDATASTSSLLSDPFNEALISWDFGDSGSGNYAYGAFANDARGSRNTSYGPCAGHVYKSAGTYTVTASGYDSLTGNPATKTITVTIRDASSQEWAGQRTILVSTSGNFTCGGLTGTPLQMTTSDFPTVVQQANTTADAITVTGNTFGRGPVRVLIRSGETITHNAAPTNVNYFRSRTGPCYWGTYDDTGVIQTGTQAIIATGNTLGTQAAMTVGFQSAAMQTMKGVTFCNINFDGTAHTTITQGYGIGSISNCDFMLALGCTFTQMNQVAINQSVFLLTSGNYHAWDGWAMVDCVHTPMNTAGTANGLFYVVGTRCYIAGNTTDSSGLTGTGSHNLRVLWADRLVIENNTFQYPNSTRHSLKIHGNEVIQRTASTAYNTTSNFGQGSYVRPFFGVQNGLWAATSPPPVFRCTVAGTSGTTEPAWNLTIGSTTTDGGVTWTCTDAATITPDSVVWRTDGNGYDTTRLVIRANRSIAPNSGWPFAFGPQDTDDWGKVRDVVCFSNWLDCGGVVAVGAGVQSAMDASCQGLHFFDNVIDLGTNVCSLVHPVAIWQRQNYPAGTYCSAYPASKIRIYNNTIRIDTITAANAQFVWVDDISTDIIIENNIFYFSGSTAGKTLTNIDDSAAGVGQVTKNKNTGDVGTITTDPLMVGPLSSIDGWAIQAGSYANGAGTPTPTVKAIRDLYGTLRAGVTDMGATQV